MSSQHEGNKRVRPLVIVISGPSGVGKDATLDTIRSSGDMFHYVVTATTRPKRVNEIDGTDYYFLSRKEFLDKIKKKEFLEYAIVYSNYYGVLRKEIRDALQKGEDVILKVDVQGAATLKRKIRGAVLIFLMPPSIADLSNRLKLRNADSVKDLNLRINKAEEEMKSLPLFDYIVINHKDNLERTADNVRSIVLAEKCRVKPKTIRL